jgi:hypothetical protein
MRRVMVIACLMSCSKPNDDRAGGSRGGGSSSAQPSPASPKTPAVSSGGAADCKKSVKICAELTPAHVDALCGTKSPTTTPENMVAGDQASVDSCRYLAANQASNVDISRTCFMGARAGEMMNLAIKQFREKPPQQGVITEVPGLGDEAFIVSAPYGARQLYVRHGTAYLTVARPGKLAADAEEAMRKDCLIALYRELAAHY